MDTIRNGMEFNSRVWKEPRGFIKILELIFGICAFATTSSYSSFVGIKFSCSKDISSGAVTDRSKKIEFSYPFDLEKVQVPRDPCVETGTSMPLGGSYSSSAEFFVAVGVLTFLYCLAALLVYIFLEKLYRSRDTVPQIDFVITVTFAFLWLVCSSAWARGITGLKASTDPDNVAKLLKAPGCTYCEAGEAPDYADLNISVILGFLNFFIWSGNVWFLYKETSWFKGNNPNVVVGPGVGSGAPGAPAMMQPNKI